MTSADLLADAFDRIKGVVGRALDGLTDEQLAAQVGPAANTIAWLVWHLTRIQDDHVCDVAGIEQAWTAQGWDDRFGLPFPVTDHGYGHTERQVEAVRVSGELLRGYHDAVYARTIEYVKTLRTPTSTGSSTPLGPAGDPGGAAGQRDLRRPAARRPGRVRQGPAAHPLTPGGQHRRAVYVFDVNETLSDLAPMGRRFAEVGLPPDAARLWFAALLRDGIGVAAAGGLVRSPTSPGACWRRW